MFSPWTVFERIYYFKLRGAECWWLQRHREKYFPSAFFLLLPRHLLQLTDKFRWRQRAVISADILPVMEALVTESCFWITHVNTDTHTHTHALKTDIPHFTEGKSQTEIDNRYKKKKLQKFWNDEIILEWLLASPHCFFFTTLSGPQMPLWHPSPCKLEH